MRGRAVEVLALITLLAAMAFAAGCQPQPQAPANERQARLLAAQSADLQKQLAATRREIESLHQKNREELRWRDEKLAKYEARIEALQKDIQEGIAARAGSVAATVMEENAKLRQEIALLKAQAEKLKAALAEENVPQVLSVL